MIDSLKTQLIETKAQAYDLIANKEYIEQQLFQINQKILELTQKIKQLLEKSDPSTLQQ